MSDVARASAREGAASSGADLPTMRTAPHLARETAAPHSESALILAVSDNPPSRVTLLIREAGKGNRIASEELLPLVYDELRQLARIRMARETPGQTLQPTALVHEAYLRLVQSDDLGWEGRGHFFAAAAEAMRRILIERARKRAAARHGGLAERTVLTDIAVDPDVEPETLIAVDDALTKLESIDADMARVVKLRYFAGLSVDETADALGISPRGVNRHWTSARAWLQRELTTSY